MPVQHHASELLRVERVAARALEEVGVRSLRHGGPANSAPKSLVVSSRDSGESRSAVTFARPPPQSGRRSRRSGRAVASTRIGTPLAQSTTWSTKSSNASSAQCRSSNTRTSGCSSASASRSRRQAVKASPRRSPEPRSSVSMPTRGRRCRSSHATSDGSGTTAATAPWILRVAPRRRPSRAHP